MYKKWIETYSPKFEPNIWNSNINIQGSHNCYAYFLNDISPRLANIYKQEDKEDRKILNPQPGHYCGMTKFVNLKETTCDVLNKRILCDNSNIKILSQKEGQDYDCGPNFYKGALRIKEGEMYHFYRQDEDGSWSHKDGGKSAIKLEKGVEEGDKEYPKFCNYYCVPKNDYMDTNMGRNRRRDNKMWYKN